MLSDVLSDCLITEPISADVIKKKKKETIMWQRLAFLHWLWVQASPGVFLMFSMFWGLKTEASGEISLTASTEQLLWLQKEVIMSWLD